MSLDDSMLGESISCSIQSSSQPDMSDATWHHRTSSFHSAESDEAYGSDKSGIIYVSIANHLKSVVLPYVEPAIIGNNLQVQEMKNVVDIGLIEIEVKNHNLKQEKQDHGHLMFVLENF